MQGLFDGVSVAFAFKDFEDAGFVVRIVGMNAHPPTVAALVEAGDRTPKPLLGIAVDDQVMFAQEFGFGVARVNADGLRFAARAQAPEFRCGQSCSGD